MPAEASAAPQNRAVHLQQLGLLPYPQAWQLQQQLFDQIVAQKLANRHHPEPQATSNHLLLLQHPPVYTLGKSGSEENLLASPQQLHALGASFLKVNRGGDITHHAPGQLVAYPIFDLENFYTDIHRYLRELEEVVIQTIAHWGLVGQRSPGYTGVWVEDRKICAMGVRTSRWVSMHGLALNVCNDLSLFAHIVPCGIADKAVTSLSQEQGRVVTIDEVTPQFLAAFQQVFGLHWA